MVGVGTGRATAAALIANHCAPVEIELISTLTYTARAATVGWRSNAIRSDGHAIQVQCHRTLRWGIGRTGRRTGNVAGISSLDMTARCAWFSRAMRANTIVTIQLSHGVDIRADANGKVTGMISAPIWLANSRIK